MPVVVFDAQPAKGPSEGDLPLAVEGEHFVVVAVVEEEEEQLVAAAEGEQHSVVEGDSLSNLCYLSPADKNSPRAADTAEVLPVIDAVVQKVLQQIAVVHRALVGDAGREVEGLVVVAEFVEQQIVVPAVIFGEQGRLLELEQLLLVLLQLLLSGME